MNNNNSSGCTYRFIESSLSLLSKDISYDIEIRQQPVRAKMSIINERDRRPIEPPPILQIHWKNCTDDELKKCLQSPFYFVVANLVTESDPVTPLLPIQDYLSGSTVSSLHRLRDLDNSDGGFFVFGDLAVKKEGKFKLRFSLFEIVEGQVQNRKTLLSNTFTVFIPKQFPGPVEATFLSRTFSDQGVKMRIRKEHRLQSRKRKVENSEKNTSLKRYQKTSRIIVSSPPYADSHTSTSDVFFGRWQATTSSSTSSSSSSSSIKAAAPVHSFEKEDTEHKSYTNRFKHHDRYLSSPESSLDSQPPTKPYPRRFHPDTPILHNPLSFSPPSLPSLAKYHNYTDKNPNYARLPTPPVSLTDIHQHAVGSSSWGTRLPPLRAIMNDHNKDNYPLLLPPPPSLYHR